MISNISFTQKVSEEILITNNKIQLLGTLTYSDKNSPLIIWVHGSGNIDRNGNQAGTVVKANYIKQFRDAINKKEIAFFSYDKRTANSKNRPIILKEGTVFNDFISDVNSVITHLKTNYNFSKIIVIGHSQGSLVAMQALEKADKFISIAGTGETIDKTIVKQIGKQNPAFKKIVSSHFKELDSVGSITNVNPFLQTLFHKKNQSFLASWMKEDPVENIKNVKIPTLIIHGSKDLQITIEDAKNLNTANTKSKLVVIDNMNHILKDIQKDEDNLLSYSAPNFLISKKLIEVIYNFILSEN